MIAYLPLTMQNRSKLPHKALFPTWGIFAQKNSIV